MDPKTILAGVLSAIITFVLSEPVQFYYRYFIHVARNADRLFEHLQLLEGQTEDLQHGVRAVEVWVNQVKALKQEVDNFKRDYERWKDKIFISRVISRYGIAMRAGNLLERADLLTKMNVDTGRFLSPPPDQERDTSNTILGLESALEEALGYIQWESPTPPPMGSDLPNHGPRVIGIFGVGGVGKTTLLKKINNYFASRYVTNEFDHIVWATVSRDVDLEKLQKEIANCLELSLPSTHSFQQRADVIRGYMKDKSFLLLLDDLWALLDLEELGIPNLQRGGSQLRRKVVFTTRSGDVCDFMQAMDTEKGRIKVAFLSKENAWKLFRSMLGKFNDSDCELENMARAVAEHCGGLPLALKVIGASMSSRKSMQDWEDALESLKESQPIRGVKDGIFHTLKHSYDYLNDDRMRECFLCCALWPEDWGINKNELIQSWMGLGLLDRHGIDENYRVGREYIQALKDACLLEAGYYEEYNVKMHDVIRDMALYIAYDKYKWMVRARVRLKEAPRDMKQWIEAEGVSLMYNQITTFPIFERKDFVEQALLFPKLSTLMLQNNNHNLEKIPKSFFPCMLNLTYLDLSANCKLKELPHEICDLTQLKYLNLSYTGIRSIPQELGRLEKLRYLFLNNTGSLESEVTLEMMPRALQMLNLYMSSLDWEGRGEEIFEGLNSLQVLEGITVQSTRLLQMLSRLSYVQLWRIQMKKIDGPASLNIDRNFGNFGHITNHLRELNISELSNLKELEVNFGVGDSGGMAWNLRKLEDIKLEKLTKLERIVWRGVEARDFLPRLETLSIHECYKLENVSWVLQLPCLKYLYLTHCYGMKTLFDETRIIEGAANMHVATPTPFPIFPCLKKLYLIFIPNLEGIYRRGLVFPSLKHILVRGCWKLRSLPFQWPLANSELSMICGEQEWWDGLQWGDERIKTSLHTHFHPFPVRPQAE